MSDNEDPDKTNEKVNKGDAIQNGGLKQQNAQDGRAKNRGARRNTKSVSNENDEDEGWLCKLCKTNFKRKSDKVLQCEYCSKHFCIQCLDMPVKLYNQLSSRLDIKWFCPQCNEKVEKNLKADREIEEKCRLLIESVEVRLRTLEEKSEHFITADEVRYIISKETKSEHTKQNSTVDNIDNLANVNDAVRKEINEREKRKNNAILFRVSETDTNIKADRTTHDTNVIKDIATKIDVEIKLGDIVRVSRLGKKAEGEGSSNIRPLLVGLSNCSLMYLN